MYLCYFIDKRICILSDFQNDKVNGISFLSKCSWKKLIYLLGVLRDYSIPNNFNCDDLFQITTHFITSLHNHDLFRLI